MVAQAEVTSSNTVGFQNIQFDQTGWMMNVGVQFSNIAAANGAFTIDDNFFAGTATEGDQIITLEADAWNLNQYDKAGTGAGWVLTPADGSDSEVVQSISIAKGDFFYYIPVSATEVNVAGQVADTDVAQSITFDLNNAAGQWMFPLVNPYPVDTTWGEINAFTKEGDQIIALNGDAWNLDQYDRAGDGQGWVLTPADGSDSELITDDTAIAIPAGGAVYYIPTTTVTWTVTL